MLKIMAVCSLCGHEYARWSDEAESDAHMLDAHGMRFEPGSLRAGDPPRWVHLT